MINVHELDPEAVLAEVVEWSENHIWRLRMQFDISALPQGLEPAGNVGLTVRSLVAYAQRGVKLDAPVAEYLLTITELLYSCAHPYQFQSAELHCERRDSDPETAIDAVIRAALARDTLEVGLFPVPLAWLACLAGVTIGTIRVYASKGELAASKGEVAPDEARRWLSGRGIEVADKRPLSR